MKAPDTVLCSYVGYCPSCGASLTFGPMGHYRDTNACRGTCPSKKCKRSWSFVFDLDNSGTFGVMSFQCDNEDRILNKESA